MLSLSDVSLRWQHNGYLLQNFSLAVQSGEIAVLQGPSGCGKSTLLSVIAGTNVPSLTVSGEVTLNGKSILGLPAEQRHIAILFQEALLFPHLTIADNLGFGLPAGLSRKARHDAINDALQKADMAQFADADPATLSGGQKARIAMMRAMLSSPDALLMDESFASLDPHLRQQFGRFVSNEVRSRAIPALLISHHEDDKEFATGPVIHWPGLRNKG